MLNFQRKPARWAFTRGLVAPGWGWFWESCLLCFPLWGKQGDPIDLVSKQLKARAADTGAGPVWATTPFGPALDYIRANRDFIDIPLTLDNYSGATSTLQILCSYDSYDSGGSVLFGTNSGTSKFWQIQADDVAFVGGGTNFAISPAVTFTDGIVRHLTFREGGGTKELFVNGVQHGTRTQTTSMSTGAKNFALGKWLGGNQWDHDGKIISASFHSIAFTDAQIRQLACDPFGPFRMFDDIPAWLAVAAATTSFPPWKIPISHLLAR